MNDNRKWYSKSGIDSDVVISTRIRLARNLKNIPFPSRMTLEQKHTVENKVRAAIIESNSYISSDFRFIDLENLSKNDAVSMVERHLVSPDFISDMTGKALIINSTEEVSIMVNEEDHIRIQVMSEGFDLDKTFETADRIDTLISESAPVAFDSRLGYLTQCPTNLGTGMRASVMLHLPGLQESGAISRITANLSKLGIVIRGTYGEGTNVTGALYQLSNQITLGLSEAEALSNLKAITKQLIVQERKVRSELIQNMMVQDKISRAAGVLRSAKVLTTAEFMNMVSLLRFGVSTNLIYGISPDQINDLVVRVQPATIGDIRDPKERDIRRATIVRSALANITE